MSAVPRAARAGVTLRHWTADSLSFVGGRENPSRESSAVELVNGRLLRLVASRLKRLKVTAARETGHFLHNSPSPN